MKTKAKNVSESSTESRSRFINHRDKGFITASDLKNSLSLYLEFPVTEAEINDFMEEADIEHTGNVSFKEFLKLCECS